jgi:hypothetical protein
MKRIDEAAEISFTAPQLASLMRDVLAKSAAFRFKARGFSMSPVVKDGDIITVAPRSAHKLCVGDIAAFSDLPDERLVVHRIIADFGESWLTKGDNLSNRDGLIHKSRILGLITRIERNGSNHRFGLGPEGRLLALLSRYRILPWLLAQIRKLRSVPEQESPEA